MTGRSRILILGTGGQVGSEIPHCRAASEIELIPAPRRHLDLLTATETDILRLLDAKTPQAVINCAAYTAVDRAEVEIEAAFAVNGEAPGRLARACAALGVPLVHFSTDYVFNGTATIPYKEDCPTDPLSVYGRSKEAGEIAIRQAGGRSVILRTAWVFGRFGTNFVKTMLRLGREREELRIVADQRGGPTPAADLAEIATTLAVRLSAGQELPPVIHACGEPDTTWYDFAEAIFAKAAANGHRVPRLAAITTADYTTPATRPKWSVLDCHQLHALGFAPINWRNGLYQVVDTLLSGEIR